MISPLGVAITMLRLGSSDWVTAMVSGVIPTRLRQALIWSGAGCPRESDSSRQPVGVVPAQQQQQQLGWSIVQGGGRKARQT